jgi:hypothetical protein
MPSAEKSPAAAWRLEKNPVTKRENLASGSEGQYFTHVQVRYRAPDGRAVFPARAGRVPLPPTPLRPSSACVCGASSCALEKVNLLAFFRGGTTDKDTGCKKPPASFREACNRHIALLRSS